MSDNKNITWYQPTEYTRALNNSATSKKRLRNFGIVTAGVAAYFAIKMPPKNLVDWITILLIALTIGFTWGYIVPVLLGEAIGKVSIDAKMIAMDDVTVKYEDLDYAVIGTAVIGGTQFPVLNLVTINKHSYLVGLSSKIDPVELSRALSEHGVRVEPE